MTDKIEIPEEVKKYLASVIEEFGVGALVTSDKWIYDLIQKQDNEIGVGDFCYCNDIYRGFRIDYCDNQLHADDRNAEQGYKKVPEELIAGLEKLRNG